MAFKSKLVTGVAAIAFSFGGALSVAGAQEPAPAPAPQMEAPAAAPDVNDDKLKSFAVAFLEVTKVTQSYQPRIESAQSDGDKQTLQQQAGQEMMEAVNGAEGITLDEYNSIIQAAQTDPELAQKINTHITEAATQQAPVPAEPAQ